MSEPTSVYVIGSRNGPTKVGISSKPASRVAGLQTACPFKVKYFGCVTFVSREIARALESETHRFLSPYHLHGEWFSIDPEIVLDTIRSVAGHSAKNFLVGGVAL